MKSGRVVTGLLAAVAVVFVLQLMGNRHDLNQEREAIGTAWSAVEASLASQAEVIPSLLKVLGEMEEEDGAVLQAVRDAHAELLRAKSVPEKIQASSRLDTSFGPLFLALEKYRKLRSSERFLVVQDDLSARTDRLTRDQRKYNDTLQKYNVNIGLFPKNIAASMFGFERIDAYFKTDILVRNR